VGPRAGLDVCEKSRPNGIRSPDRPARSQSLYRLSYPAHTDNSRPQNTAGHTETPNMRNVKFCLFGDGLDRHTDACIPRQFRFYVTVMALGTLPITLTARYLIQHRHNLPSRES
jgi:hypothetical protein